MKRDQLLQGNISVNSYIHEIKGYMCWSQNSFDNDADFQFYFSTLPIVFCLGVNCLILLNITRVVWSKMLPKNDNNEGSGGINQEAILKTFKATCLLIPMLGLSQILLCEYNFRLFFVLIFGIFGRKT